MKAEKDEKIDVQGGVDKSKVLHKSRKVKSITVAVLSLSLLVAAAISLIVLWPKDKVSRCLVDVHLEEGDTLMYRVDQRVEVKEIDSRKETISSVVGFQVVKKTSDAYWFLLKINTAFQDKDDKVKAAIAGYFRVRLPSTKDYIKDTPDNETTEVFDLHGYPQTDGEFVRYLHGLLYQLLPAVRRDLYEDIDGQTDKNVKPENSPLFPGPVRMHRQANTTQSGDVMIKNHFSKSDLVNSSSDMDLDVQYTDSAAINKSNGMVSESNVYVSEQLHFGEPIKAHDGHDVTTMKVKVYSHVIRIEMDSTFFLEEEIKALKTNLFVRLVVPTGESSRKDTLGGQPLSTQKPTTVIRRHRRAVGLDSNNTTTPHPVGEGGGGGMEGGNRTVASTQNITNTSLPSLPNPLNSSSVAIQKEITLFDKTFIGIPTKGKGSAWIKNTAVGNETNKWEVETDLHITLGSFKITVYRVKYDNEELEKGIGADVDVWEKEIPFCFRVLIVKLCVEFNLKGSFSIHLKPLLQETSLKPPKFAVQVESSAEVTAIVEAYASVWVVRAGIFADGTLVSVTIPIKLSYSAVKPANQQWCLASNARLTALKLHAGIFYQWKRCRFVWNWFWSYVSCWWGGRNVVYSFGEWAALIDKDLGELFKTCF